MIAENGYMGKTLAVTISRFLTAARIVIFNFLPESDNA